MERMSEGSTGIPVLGDIPYFGQALFSGQTKERLSSRQCAGFVSGVVKDLGIDKAYAAMPEEVQKTTSPSTLFQMFLLWNHHVAMMDRKSFGQIGADNMHYLRLSIATGIDDLKLGMERMANAINDKAGFAKFIEAGDHYA